MEEWVESRRSEPWLIVLGGLLLAAAAAPAAASPDGSAWLDAAKAQIDARWIGSFLRDCERQLPPEHPINAQRPTTVLALTIHPDGRLLETAVYGASGVDGFDASARDVVSASAPFPVAPLTVLAEDGRIHLRWSFHRDLEAARAARGVLHTLDWPAAKAVPAFLAQGRWQLAFERALAEAIAGKGNGQLVRAVLDRAVEDHWRTGEGRLRLLRAAVAADAPGPWADRIRAQLTPSSPLPLRQLAIDWVTARRDVASVSALEALTHSEHRAVALSAMDPLKRLGRSEATWTRLAKTGSFSRDRTWRAQVAAQLGARASMEAMIALLDARPDVETRAFAAEAIGAASRFGGRRWEVGARRSLADGRAAVHIGLLRGFARAKGSAAAYAMVKPLLDSHDLRIRAASVAAAPVVGGLAGQSRVLKICGKTGRVPVRVACVDALMRSGPRGRALLRRWMNDTEPAVRRHARDRLLELDDPETVALVARAEGWSKALRVDAQMARYRHSWTTRGPAHTLAIMAKGIDEAKGGARLEALSAAWGALGQLVDGGRK